MKTEAKNNMEADKKRKDEIDLKNQADSLIYSTEKQITELGDKLPSDQKMKIEEAKSKLAQAVKDENPANIRTAIDELNQIWSAASSQMYNQQSATPPPNGEPHQQQTGNAQTTPNDNTVEEAEYTVIEDDKKQ
ncbi:Chaperone protein dnaK2 [bioreactor metagenome]|uniref:Chaperone protein dnaK2 n=1 Tax=bioreactor metagenome TaxID=1076179 RepID=A0A645HXF6_9ZZZZ